MDRNAKETPPHITQRSSLSARRAWIEITYVTRLPRAQVVALRKESVDRNSAYLGDMPLDELSLSARRAWIEIP